MRSKRSKKVKKIQSAHARKIRILSTVVLMLCIVVTGSLLTLIKSKEVVFDTTLKAQETKQAQQIETTMFPVGVDPIKEEIIENPAFDAYVHTHEPSLARATHARTWFNRALANLALFDWYQNLASPSSRILVIEQGERKEQVAEHFKKILNWDQAQTNTFTSLVAGSSPQLSEGKFFPEHYVVHKDATPEEVASLVIDTFTREVINKYSAEVAAVVPLEDAMIIASLLEREAYDFEDMRHIAGVIWNRLFIDMNLQIDATLQYAKGSESITSWWPQVVPDDKYINSSFNTYEHKGLPPAPIANPSVAALLAALNPEPTTCFFYFHDANGGFHCTHTYEEHVALLKQYYGRGK